MIQANKNLKIFVCILFLQNIVAQNPSTLFQNWVDAQINSTTPTLPTFSYAGFKNGEEALPSTFSQPIFDITKAPYNAIPNDGISDKSAIMAAIASAEGSVNGGVIYFPPGRFIINDKTIDNESQLIKITKSNIVLKGSGSGVGGTELYQKDFVPHQEQETKPWINPYLIAFTSDYSFTKSKLADVTGNAERETYTLQVSNTDNIQVGAWVELYVKSTSANLLAEELSPYSTSDLYEPENLGIANEGVVISEYHRVAHKTANTITFKEPLHRAVNSIYNWEIRRYEPIENVGIQDLKYTGGYIWDFIHHKAPRELFPNEPEATENAFLSDAAWSGISFDQVANGWLRNVTFSNVSRAATLKASAYCTALDNTYLNNPGHSFISTNSSTGCFIGKNIDLSSGIWHGSGVSGTSIANVFWKNEHPTNGNSGLENHGSQPRSTLYDVCKGGIFFNQGGATGSLPNHLRHMVLWNFEGVSYRESNIKSWRPGSETRYSKFLMPIVSGLEGFTMSSESNQFQENESEGMHVDELSLYEKQLAYRLGFLPKWINYKQSKTKIIFSEDFEYSNSGNGFNVKFIDEGGFPNATQYNGIVNRLNGSSLPTAASSNNLFLATEDRQVMTIPGGEIATPTTIRIQGTSGGVNYPVDVFVVFNTIDLTNSNPMISEYDAYKYVSFWTRRDFNTGDIATISMKISTDYTGDVETATWQDLSIVSGNLELEGDQRTFVKAIADLTSYANGLNGTSITIAVQFKGSDTNTGNLRNGSFSIADLQIFTQNTKLEDTWHGKINSTFLNAGNWASKAAPSSNTNNILILKDAQNFPTTTNPINLNQITIESGASFIANNTVIGKTIFERNLITPIATGNLTIDNLEGWHLISAPVNNETYDSQWAKINNIALGSGSNIGIAIYDNNTPNKFVYSNGSSKPFVPGKGYSVKRASTDNISLEGDMIVDNVDNVAITSGFNLIGNPFTAFIDTEQFLTLPVNDHLLESQQIWVWNSVTKNYEVKLSRDNPSFKIAPGQGFFIKSNTSGNLSFKKNIRVHQTTDTFLKSIETQELTLKITANAVQRFTKIRYLDTATGAFDNGLDGETFTGTSNTLDVYSQLLENNNGKKYQVQSISNTDYENKVIPIGVVSSSKKDVVFSVAAKNIPSGYNVYFEDRLTKAITKLSAANETYKTTVSASENLNRFYLHLKNSSILSVESDTLLDIQIFKSKDVLRVNGLNQGNVELQLFNVLGSRILSAKLKVSSDHSIRLPSLTTGIYIVKVKTDEGSFTKKIIF